MAEKTSKSKSTKVQKYDKKKGNALPLRIASWVLWLLAIGAEVIAILILTGNMYVPEEKMTMWLIIPLVVDFILVIVAGQLWKKANDYDPASKANAFKFFIQNQLGMIMALICFVPFIILVLSNKNLKGNTKIIATVVAIVMLLVAGLASYDWNPVSAEERAADEAAYANTTVYWTTFGKVFHTNEDCGTIKNSSTIYEGKISEAYDGNKNRVCKICEKAAEKAEETTDG